MVFAVEKQAREFDPVDACSRIGMGEANEVIQIANQIGSYKSRRDPSRLAPQRPDDGGHASDEGGEGDEERGIENKHNSDSKRRQCSLFVPYLQ